MNALKLTKMVNRVQICGDVLDTETIVIKGKPRIKFSLITTYNVYQKRRTVIKCLLTEPKRQTAARLFKGSFVFITDGYLQTYKDDTYIVLCTDVAVFYEGFKDVEMTEREITEFLSRNGLESVLDKIDTEELDIE